LPGGGASDAGEDLAVGAGRGRERLACVGNEGFLGHGSTQYSVHSVHDTMTSCIYRSFLAIEALAHITLSSSFRRASVVSGDAGQD
jgi:hypothetical protein